MGNLIINKFIKSENIPKFIRITNDVIINTDSIMTIERQWENSNTYDEFVSHYNELMKSTTEEYIKKHPEILVNNEDEAEIADIMFKKFDSIIRNQIKKDWGYIPEPWDTKYIIKLFSGIEYTISDEIYYQILKVIGIEPTEN